MAKALTCHVFVKGLTIPASRKKYSITLPSSSLVQLLYSTLSNIQNWYFCSLIRKRIAYANEASRKCIEFILIIFGLQKNIHNLVYDVTVLHLCECPKTGGKQSLTRLGYWFVLLMTNSFERLLTVESLYHLSFFQDDSGHINFREYLIGLALVSQPANSEEAMELAFQVRNYTGLSGLPYVRKWSVRGKYFRSGKSPAFLILSQRNSDIFKKW